MNEPVQLHGWKTTPIPSQAIFDLRGDAFRVYAYFSFRGRTKGNCIPGLDKMAKELDMSARSLQRAIAECVKKNYVFRERRIGKSSVTHVFNRPSHCLKFLAQRDATVGASSRQIRRDSHATSGAESSTQSKDYTEQIIHSKEGRAIAPNVDITTGEILDKPVKAEKPAAVIVYHEVMHFWPHKSLYDLIVQAVGDDGLTLQRWRDILMQWLAKGYSPKNVDGVLEVFRHGWRNPKAKINANVPKDPMDYLKGKYADEILH